MQCVILAGGLATRMRPITEKIPKALILVNDRPFIHYQLKWLQSVGVTEAVLSIGYKGEMIRQEVGDGSRWNLRVVYVDEGNDLRGTGGAIRLALDQGVLNESFLVTYGDSFLPIDFSEVWRAFLHSGKPGLMTVFRNQGKWDQSNVCFDGKELLLYDKRPEAARSNRMEYIDYGLSALSRKTIQQRVPTGEKRDLAEVFHSLSVEKMLAGWEVRNRFYEIGSPDGLRDFEKWVRQNKV